MLRQFLGRRIDGVYHFCHEVRSFKEKKLSYEGSKTQSIKLFIDFVSLWLKTYPSLTNRLIYVLPQFSPSRIAL